MHRLRIATLLLTLPLLSGCGAVILAGGALLITDAVIEQSNGGNGLF